MKKYLDLLADVATTGRKQLNRTGIPTYRKAGAMLEFSMVDGFPAVTTKKLAFGAVKAELLGFIRGYSRASEFRYLGCRIWDQNANENRQWLASRFRRGEDDLGRIYGMQWRQWRGAIGQRVDQLQNALDDIVSNPSSRRIIVNAWNPAELDQMALPPCHVLHQYLVDIEYNTLDLVMFQRSCDMFLGIPFNIASYALLLHLVAKATGRLPGKLVMMLSDVHVYANHMEQADAQCSRAPFPLPTLVIPEKAPERTPMEYLLRLLPEDIQLEGYQSHPAISAPMAV